MKKIQYIIVFTVAVFSLAACANLNSIYRHNSIVKTGQTELVDAKQRAIIAVPYYYDNLVDSTPPEPKTGLARFIPSITIKPAKKPDGFRVCAEASPDVFSIYALAAAAQGGAQSNAAGDVSGEAGLSLAFSENGATIERTQTINLIRESLYRTCERYLSGAISETTMQIQAARDQRAMVAILAIEQLTGVVKRRPTILTSQAQSTLVTANSELLQREIQESLDAKTKDASYQAAISKHGEAKASYDGLHGGKCDTILQTPVTPVGNSGADSDTTKTVTETSQTLSGDTEVKETTEPVMEPQTPEEQTAAANAAKLAEQKTQCQGAKSVLTLAATDMEAKKIAASEAKEKHKATQALVTQVSSLLSADASGQGSGDAGSTQSTAQVKAVAKTVGKITQMAFDPSREMIYLCSAIVGNQATYGNTSKASPAFIESCFQLLSFSAQESFRAEGFVEDASGGNDYPSWNDTDPDDVDPVVIVPEQY